MTERRDTVDEGNESPLDANLRQLLGRAPERERLDDAARTRLADALRAQSAETERPHGPAPSTKLLRPVDGAPGRPRLATARRRRAILAAAGVLAAAALGAVLFGPSGGSAPDRPGSDGRLAREGGDPAAAPERVPADADSPQDRGSRAPAAPDAADEALAGAEPVDQLDPESDVLGALWFEGGAADSAGIDVIEVWSRPVVGLPRVADSEVLRVALGPDTPAADAPLAFALAGERARARALGADRIEVTAIAPGFGRGAVTIATGDGAAAAVPIAAGVTVEGTVTDGRTGTPIAGALVIPLTGLPLDSLDVGIRPSDALPATWAETDASGRFRLTGVTGRPVRLRASAPGFAPATAEPPSPDRTEAAESADASAPPLRVALELRPGGAVEGIVEREDGSRFAGALVIASHNVSDPRQGRRDPLTYGGAVTDAAGHYRIEDLPEGAHVVLVFGADAGRGGAPRAFRFTGVRRGETARVDFLSSASSARAGSITGTLRGPDGDPIPGASLTIGPTESDGADWSATTTAADGAFRFEDLAPGEYTLLGAEDDFRTLSLVWSGEVPGPVTLDLALSSHRIELAPYTEEPAGREPLVEGWAMLERRADDGAWDFAGNQDVRGAGRPISGIPAGRYRATYVPIDSSGLGVAFSEPFEVPARQGAPPGEAAIVLFEVPPGRALEVQVVDAAGDPVRRATVDVVHLGLGRAVPTAEPIRTDLRGRALVPAVPLGRVRIEAERRGVRASVEVAVEAGEGPAAPVRIVLD